MKKLLLLILISFGFINFSIANEDHNAYTFDMRNLSRARVVHKDHVGAVMDIR